MAMSFIAYNFSIRSKRSSQWCMYCLWILFLGMRITYSQSYPSLTEDERLELRTTAHVVVDLNDASFDTLSPILVPDNVPLAVIPFESSEQNASFFEQYVRYQNQLVVLGQEGSLTKVPENLSMVWVADSDVESVELISKGKPNLSQGANEKELLGIYPYRGNEPTYNELLDIWQYKGKMPNFIKAESSFEHIDSLVRRLNRSPKIFGTVRTEEGLLDGVIFKNYSGAQVDGYFSYPVLDTLSLPILVPYKPGFHFSPDIIYTTPENLNNKKEFVGFPLNPEYGLSHHFEFKEGPNDVLAKNGKGLISNDVMAKKDSVYGKVSYFADGAYVDVGISSKASLKGNFTISAWIRPTQRGHNNSILGKGDNFVFKIHDGFLTFTMAGIKDYMSTSSPIPLNEWSHVALVHSKMGNTLFFYINGERTDSVELISEYETSDYNILIGSNLWEEFFEGYIREIKIWERELNDAEISAHYAQTITLEKDRDFLGYIVTLLVLFGAGYIVFRYRRKQPELQGSNQKKAAVLPKVHKERGAGQGQIRCFGPLKIIDKNGSDLAKKLSPLQKKMFMIIFLHSQGSEKGIDTKGLTELLWPGRSVADAKNTRGTTIQNLRQQLATCSGLEVLFRERLWFLHLGGNCYSDYAVALEFLEFLDSGEYSDKELEAELRNLIPIVNKGRLFASTSAAWLDPFIERFSNQIVEQFIQISKNPNISRDTDIMFDLAEVICLYDDLNEHALHIKLNVFIEQGKLSLAHQAYHNFKKQYEKLYGEAYEVSFEDFIASQ